MAIQAKRLDELLAAFGRMTRREKFLVGGLGFFFLLFVVVVLSLWISSSLESRERRIAEKTAKVQAIVDLRGQYEEAKESQKRAQELMRAGKNIQLLSTLDSTARQVGVNIGDMKTGSPTVDSETHIIEDKVEVNIPLITIDRLVEFLQELERKSRTIMVRKLRVQQSFREPSQLEVNFSISNLKVMDEKEAAPAAEKPAAPVRPPAEGPKPK